MRRTLLFYSFLLLPLVAEAQITQTLRGVVVDQESQSRLWAASVSVFAGEETVGGTTTDSAGRFSITGIPIGAYTVQVSSLGYAKRVIPNLVFTSGKEVVLHVELTDEGQKIQEVIVRAEKKGLVNEMALVSAYRFDVEETERFAGSRGDPARMASNYAGVQGADDSRNDIIIRGNSPQGVLWRLEDIPIPSPNHFAVPGSSGGPVSMINNKTLGNSDFFAGAFPAEYGNAIGGVFDLKMRKGNPARHELSLQLGFLGTELAAEGPLFKKSGASYLLAYRYSTLKLFEGLNIKIGTNSVPNYQDAALKLNFPIGKKSNISVFGIGGLSNIDLVVSKFEEPTDELYGEDDRDQYFTSNTGVAGVSFQSSLNKNTLLKAVIGQTFTETYAQHDKVFRNAFFKVDSLKNILGYYSSVGTTEAHVFLNHKINTQHTIKFGLLNSVYYLNFVDSSRQYPPSLQQWQHRSDYQGVSNLLQPYVQHKWRLNSRFTTTAGVHLQWFSLNNSVVAEPRLAVQYQSSKHSRWEAGYGLHSQTQPLYQYFSHHPQYESTAMHNFDMGFTRSHHFVLGYEQKIRKQMRVRLESYYQYLFNIPIEIREGSSFSGLNQGANFSRLFPDTLVNKGTGYNYGVELTLEKGLSKGYYALLTASLFNSKARGADGVYRSTDYNSHFGINLLGGYEYKIGLRSQVTTGLKISYAGGRLYSPADIQASNAKGDLVVIDSLRNTLRFPNYFRVDIKLAYRYNARRITHEIGLDLVNVFGTKNVLSLVYNPDLAAQGQDPFVQQYQLGFLPLFYYRVDFGIGK